MLTHIMKTIALITVAISFLFLFGIRVAKARFMYINLRDPSALLPDKPFRSYLIREGMVYLMVVFFIRPSLDDIWTWKNVIFLFLLFLGCWVVVHGILILRLYKRREIKGEYKESSK